MKALESLVALVLVLTTALGCGSQGRATPTPAAEAFPVENGLRSAAVATATSAPATATPAVRPTAPAPATATPASRPTAPATILPLATPSPATSLPSAPFETPVARRKAVVAIDPGHGGPHNIGAAFTDSRTRVVLREKDVNLEVARILRDILIARGYEVVLTRDGDYSLTPFQESSLAESVRKEIQARVDLAHQKGADLLVSVHFNGFPDPNLRGTETYYNAHRPFSAKNRRLAEAVQRNLASQLRAAGYPAVDRGIKTDEMIGQRFGYSFSFLLGENPGFERPSQMPAVIGEALFLTNPQEGELLKNPLLLKAIAEGYARGIEEYFSQEG